MKYFLPVLLGVFAVFLISSSSCENGFKEYDIMMAIARNIPSLKWVPNRDKCEAGKMPGVVCRNNYVQKLNLASARIDGTIPKEIGRLSQLEELDLSNNKFHGPIPVELTHLPKVKKINLSWNRLTGFAPQEFEDMGPQLKYLALNNNKLQGRESAKIKAKKLDLYTFYPQESRV